ncbi:muscle M-line assembly protein unc-89 [Fundulus heteroclitus]|uniref:muscle M-line assembly protein unc-89 n=1 Tax=Fundulus heteroclitus TaxID=8078 RepID=UPI00165CA170|nr:muscle M-line assembly protein unc-89 [Fundulus heteroclitus]
MPRPEIRWFHNRQPVQPSKNVVFHFDEVTNVATLIIVDAFPEHAGQYTCRAANRAGEAACSAGLTVTREEEVDVLDKRQRAKPRSTNRARNSGEPWVQVCSKGRSMSDPVDELLELKLVKILILLLTGMFHNTQSHHSLSCISSTISNSHDKNSFSCRTNRNQSTPSEVLSVLAPNPDYVHMAIMF